MQKHSTPKITFFISLSFLKVGSFSVDRLTKPYIGETIVFYGENGFFVRVAVSRYSVGEQ
jgi:hypothetical protein